MSGTIANLIKARGLETFGSELSNAEGSQRQAVNVNIDEEGVITPRRGFNDYSTPTTGVETIAATVSQIMEYKDAILRQYQDQIEYEITNGTFELANGSFNVVRSGYRTKFQEANSNLYFTSAEGIKKISVKNRSNMNADMITNAGGVKAGYSEGFTVPVVGGFLPPESKVAYRVVYGTKDNNNNLILGSPSSRFIITNFNNNEIVPEQSSITFSTTNGTDEVSNGDHFVYSTKSSKFTIYYDADGTATEPQTSETIGSSYIKVSVLGNTDNDDNLAAITANVIASNISEVEVSLSSSNVVTITSLEEDDLSNITLAKDSSGVDISSRVSTQVIQNGNIVNGTSSNVRVEGVIPSEVTTDYFYQIYRSAPITVVDGLDINDLDPGDELNLVFEAPVTQAEITAGSFSVVDTTPESFRAEAVPLYTNQITGQGILQANEPPPIALDLELFRNYTFYANTKERHRLEYTVVSVDDFISNSTRIVIGNSEITRFYTFVGTAEESSFTIIATPNDGDSILLNSANNTRKYYLWFDVVGDATGNPDIAERTGYKVDASDSPTNEELATRIQELLLNVADFQVTTSTNQVTILNTNNGYTDGIQAGPSLSNVTINNPTVDGTGELSSTDEGGDILLSGLISVGQSIDQTARSIVKVISQDSLSPVNAYYLSTGDDLPGNILLENRSLEDVPFYISIQEQGNDQIGGEFSPEIPYSKEIEEFTGLIATTSIQVTDHGYNTGDEVFLSYFKDPNNPADPESFSDIYTITVIDSNNFTIPLATPNTVVSFVPTFSGTSFPDLTSDNKELPNRVYYSKRSQPEAVPLINFIDIGEQDSEIKRVLALRDNLFVLKDDGIFVISGTSAPNWSTRLIDNTKILAPDSAVVLNNQIYCLTEQGITRITASGAAIISRGIEDQIDDITNKGFDYESNTFGVAYENDRAYIMFAPETEEDTSSTQAFRYNIFEQTWSKWDYSAKCGHVLERDNKLYVGNGDRNYISQERKNFEREDHADRNFSNNINSNGVLENVIEISSIQDVSTNDVIVQEQSVTINYLNNRILSKMDLFDTSVVGPSGESMVDSFAAKIGDNMPSVMQSLNDYLVTLDPVYITAKSFTFENLRSNTELLVNELNLADSFTSKKSYILPETVFYEAYIKELDAARNQITTHITRPFLEGAVEIYKGFTCTVEWNPQHFGNPSALKQIRYITIMFDQNNFYDATAKFYSDAAQALVEVPFQGKGIGYWGDMPWGNPNHYWGGVGNDIPFRTPVPRGKQKCRYLSITFEHKNAREYFRILGVSGVVRMISDRGYR